MAADENEQAIRKAMLAAMAPMLDQLGVSADEVEAAAQVSRQPPPDPARLPGFVTPLRIELAKARRQRSVELTEESIRQAGAQWAADVPGMQPSEVNYDAFERLLEEKRAQSTDRELDVGELLREVFTERMDPDTGRLILDKDFLAEHGSKIFGAVLRGLVSSGEDVIPEEAETEPEPESSEQRIKMNINIDVGSFLSGLFKPPADAETTED